MVTGIGTDIVETGRIAKAIEKEKGFRELVFSKNEIAYCESKTNKYQHYAARFAAKEAFFKAMGTGWKNGTAFHEVEIINTGNGKPELQLLGETAVTVGAVRIHVSLSHVKSMATAVVVIEQ
ncbi:holo-ACP synthase [Agriterribacter sp.]|uniref:holo-ACP synthase n=1 Tax=Agriterribacter sp. TaxID=2821509 RepID=UPI002B5BBD97|nr:holo-ACP synthase [Agriterribacter sp.]HRO47626.1 holo-ACP synthase [Agriterribacter sp.]HRQ17170.1 holo-ACP synthase [Agriterribacter sp.]